MPNGVKGKYGRIIKFNELAINPTHVGVQFIQSSAFLNCGETFATKFLNFSKISNGPSLYTNQKDTLYAHIT